MNARKDKAKTQRAQQNKQLQRVEKPLQKEEPRHGVARKMGDFCIDVAKLIIGGVILAGLMKQDIDYWVLVTMGGVAVFVFLMFGIYLINYSNKEGGN